MLWKGIRAMDDVIGKTSTFEILTGNTLSSGGRATVAGTACHWGPVRHFRLFEQFDHF